MKTEVATTGLTNEEAEFVYSVEVLGLPVRKAAQLANMSLGSIGKPHIAQAREVTKRQIRGSMQITREDITFRMLEAIDRARILGEPMTEIVGLDKVAKLNGLDAPQRVDINLRASIEVVQANVRSLSDTELVELLGAGDVIDAEFYETHKD